MRAASARQLISMELKCADSSNTPRPVACAALRCSRPFISVMRRMRSFDDHQLIGGFEQRAPQAREMFAQDARARFGRQFRQRELEVAARDALERRGEQEHEQPERRGPVDRAA